MANKNTRALRKAVGKKDLHTFCLHTNNTGAAPSPINRHEHGPKAFKCETRKRSKPVFTGKRTDLPPWLAGWERGMPPVKGTTNVKAGQSTFKKQTVYSEKRNIDALGIKPKESPKPASQPQAQTGYKPGLHGVKNSSLKSPFKKK